MARKRKRAGNPKTPKVQDIGLQTGDAIAFIASRPLNASGFQHHGDGGFRIALDVAQDQAPAMKQFMDLIHTAFEVTIRPRLGAVPGGQEDGAEAAAPAVVAQD